MSLMMLLKMLTHDPQHVLFAPDDLLTAAANDENDWLLLKKLDLFGVVDSPSMMVLMVRIAFTVG